MVDRIDELPVPEHNDRQVSMSNRLARAAHGLNLAEKRLVAIALAATDSVSTKAFALGANAGWKTSVNALDYAETFGLHPTTAYEQLRNAAENLFERYVRYEIKGRRGEIEEKKFRWVSAVVYREGYVELNFSPETAPHLLGLRKQFTTYKLVHAAVFDTVYAWRLYEVLKSWQSTGLYTTPIEKFWDTMEAPASCRKDFKALRTRVIEPAIASIQAKANMLVDWKPLRSGSRRVTGLEFRITPDPQARLEMDDEEGANAPAEETPVLGHQALESD